MKTAVEWLVDKLQIFATEEEMNIIEQAKEMEKEQMRAMFAVGMVNGINIDFEQFYKETYESNT